jgi:hypothetical protein
MLSLVSALLHFILIASDPSWSCASSHRDPGVAGTYYLYCSQVSPEGVELIDVGRFIPDVPRARRVKP